MGPVSLVYLLHCWYHIRTTIFLKAWLISFSFLPILFELASEMSLLTHQHPPERPDEF